MIVIMAQSSTMVVLLGCLLLAIMSSSIQVGACAFDPANQPQRLLQEDNNADNENRSFISDIISDVTSGIHTNNTSNATTTTTTSTSSTNNNCTIDPSFPLTGARVELRMLARQTRGVVHLLSNCQLQLSKLEVALAANNNEQSIALDWYQAESTEPQDIANRTFLASFGSSSRFTQEQLVGNTDTAATLWTTSTVAADLTTVGALVLCERRTDGSTQVLAVALIHKLQPGPAADLLAPQPTYFDHCRSLSDTVRLRWSLMDNTIDIGLEYIVGSNGAEDNTWMAFGPAAPQVQDRLMGGSDVLIAGFRLEDDNDDDDPTPFAMDYYIGGYEVCTRLDTTSDSNNNNSAPLYDGVCRDSVWSGMDDNNNHDNVELLHSQILEGVALLRVRRPLQATADPDWDHAITPGTPQHFVWARGPLDPSAGMAEVQFHGYQFGQLKDMDVNDTTAWSCPPLQGIALGGGASTTDDDASLEDEFAKMFEHQTTLQGGVVQVFWTFMPESNLIHIGARAMVGASKWMSIAIGESMTDAWAWVATMEHNDDDEPQLLTYRMSGLDATTVQVVSDEEKSGMVAGHFSVSSDNTGHLSFDVMAQWPLPGMNAGDTSAPLIWALGPSWRGPPDTSPRRQDEHSLRSKAPTSVDFATGGALVGEASGNVLLLAHGAFMWIAWLVVAPLVGVASRYLRGDPCLSECGGYSWIQLHKAGAMAVAVLSLVGLILSIVAVRNAGLIHVFSSHARVGVALLAMVVVQNFFGVLRPDAQPQTDSFGFNAEYFTKRKVWELSHRLFAIAMLGMAIAATITGSTRLEKFDLKARYGIPLSVAWIVFVLLLFVVYEVRKQRIACALSANADAKSEHEDERISAEEAGEQSNAEPPGPTKPSPSPWISTLWFVYAVPFCLSIAVLVVLTAIAFTGSSDTDAVVSTTQQAAAASTTEQISETSTAVPPTDKPTNAPYVPNTNFDAPETCGAVPRSYVGDGWCDDYAPFNTAECAWDGGDCCNATLPLYNCQDPESPNFGATSARGWPMPLPVPRNPRYTVTREESLESFVISYNNYYEFGFSKDVVAEATKHADFLAPESWYMDVSGLVDNPMTIDVSALVSQMHLEERLYRHRCVEAWSITAPWIGFPLAKLMDLVQPQPEAAIVQFVSWKDFAISSTQSSSNYPWPYTEALTMEEARNELTMLTVGAFGKPLTPQQGAPIRLTVPWKYGFKSIKSIEKIHFLVDDENAMGSRNTFWSQANGREYGFYANVNPEVPHPRWSQETERHYVVGFPGTRLDTTRMNGYQEQVDYLYEGNLDNQDIYF